ncbi:MAG: hypothetical protein KH745_07405, partial [Bilophila sp.]|nr:hypothetical protein [Bilophila sp.]
METRKTKVIFTKAGGNANGSPSVCRISLPKAWVNRMGLTPERREVELAFDGDKVSIQNLKESPAKRRMLADKKKIRRFADTYTIEQSNGRDLSVDLGEICHYLTDFF